MRANYPEAGAARKEQGWGRAIPVSAKTSTDSRSLVGMSMSARKRAARRVQTRTHIEECYRGTVEPADKPAEIRRFCVPRCHLVPYRIGERLKPCPGCTGCSIWMIREKKPQQFVGRWVPKTQEDRDDPAFLEQILQLLDLVNACSPQDQRTSLSPICDGSGTLPAGKKKRR